MLDFLTYFLHKLCQLISEINQLNADGIRPKFAELRDQLINSDIDVLAAQMLKFWKTDKTPFIKGYATVRKDRNNILGGGLLFFIRTTSYLTNYILSRKQAWRFYPFVSRLLNQLGQNSTMYICRTPPTQHNSFNPSLIKPGLSSLILGDLSGTHSNLKTNMATKFSTDPRQ